MELGLKAGFVLHLLFLKSGATDIVFVTLFRTAVETATAKYTSCCAMASGHSRNIFVVLAAVHGSLGLPGWRLSRAFTLYFPLSPLSPSLIASHLASMDVQQNNSSVRMQC